MQTGLSSSLCCNWNWKNKIFLWSKCCFIYNAWNHLCNSIHIVPLMDSLNAQLGFSQCLWCCYAFPHILVSVEWKKQGDPCFNTRLNIMWQLAKKQLPPPWIMCWVNDVDITSSQCNQRKRPFDRTCKAICAHVTWESKRISESSDEIFQSNFGRFQIVIV